MEEIGRLGEMGENKHSRFPHSEIETNNRSINSYLGREAVSSHVCGPDRDPRFKIIILAPLGDLRNSTYFLNMYVVA